MTGWQLPTMTPDTASAVDPYRFPGAAAVDDDPRPAVPSTPEPVDYLLAAPDPDLRVPVPLEPADRRRLDLHAALTTAGIAPLPGDLAAIEALCTLDDTTHAALQRWITHTA
ncbi:hypothetical protein [Streptomyces xantholiticus]|uniref:hypothetical protein n=1 Tax=Streptomyces xantholiticus TaxID=68285 RepID=UPI001E2DE0EA|nr:hypothetical protein [Streptomyces xantholiticus]